MLPISPPHDYYAQESKRLSFRAFNSGDINLWEPFFVDNPTLRFVGLGDSKDSKNSLATLWISKQVERQSNKAFGQLAVIRKKDNTFIGVGGIISREIEGNIMYEITYSLLPSAWGSGFATELALHFKEYALQLGLNSIVSIIHVENNASMNVARKNGMVKGEETSFMGMPVCIFKLD